jgi:hypothetical protein
VNMYEINIRASPTTVSSILNYLQKLENKIGVHFSIDLNDENIYNLDMQRFCNMYNIYMRIYFFYHGL